MLWRDNRSPGSLSRHIHSRPRVSVVEIVKSTLFSQSARVATRVHAIEP